MHEWHYDVRIVYKWLVTILLYPIEIEEMLNLDIFTFTSNKDTVSFYAGYIVICSQFQWWCGLKSKTQVMRQHNEVPQESMFEWLIRT